MKRSRMIIESLIAGAAIALVAVLIFTAVSCATEAKTESTVTYPYDAETSGSVRVTVYSPKLIRYIDDETGVVCFAIGGMTDRSISCAGAGR